MNENFKVAAIIHFYRDTIFDDELIALNQCEKVLSYYPIIAVNSESLVLPEVRENAKNTVKQLK